MAKNYFISTKTYITKGQLSFIKRFTIQESNNLDKNKILKDFHDKIKESIHQENQTNVDCVVRFKEFKKMDSITQNLLINKIKDTLFKDEEDNFETFKIYDKIKFKKNKEAIFFLNFKPMLFPKLSTETRYINTQLGTIQTIDTVKNETVHQTFFIHHNKKNISIELQVSIGQILINSIK